MKLYNDKCENILKGMEENTIDAVVTDPPYGINFMNKKWDYDVPSVDTFKEIFRVMKPGATLLCFAGTRTQHRMAVNIEDAGFILKDTIMWLYGSGFPKATDISKQLDKGVEREVVGTRIQRFGLSENKGWNTNNLSRTNAEIDITAPSTEEAKKWDGWKSHGLKPAYEPIIVAVKPNDGSYAENALKWGVSGINIDACRVKGDLPSSSKAPGRFPANIILSHHPECKLKGTKKVKPSNGSGVVGNQPKHEKELKKSSIYGKYINTDQKGYTYLDESGYEIVDDYDCHEDCPVKILDDQSGLKSGALLKHHKINESENRSMSGKNYAHNSHQDFHASEGGASRFFYCAKAGKAERNMGCNNLEEKQITKENNHPTVKPIKVMEYLCKLVSMPTKITVLDPYMGSGTTGIACNNIGLDFIGIEKNPNYFKIAETRLNHVTKEKIEEIEKIEKSKTAIELFFK